MAISITPSPFGSVTVTLDGELGGVLSVGVLATSNSALNMDLGVPGPQGEAGEPGANGQNGEGVPIGGSAGQVLAKIDSTDYNTEWIDQNASGVWGQITGTLSNQTDLQTALDGKLSLSGGTMTGDITFSVDGNGNDSLLGAFGFGVENTNGQVAYIQPDVFRIYDNDHLIGTSVSGEGITFNDSTVQITAGLPLVGGTMTGAINYGVNGEVSNNVVLNSGGLTVQFDYDNYRTIVQPANISMYEDVNAYRININPATGYQIINGGTVYSSLTKDGVTFPDETTQTTAGLPLTGGTMTGQLIINSNPEYGSITLASEFISFQDNFIRFDTDGLRLSSTAKLTFPNLSVQTTAFPPAGGTTSQYIDGTGALETFPPLGDRYFTTSTSTLTCDSANGKTMTVGTGLSYSRQQDITVSYNNANHMHGTVLTYDPATGVMTFDSNTHSGGGTYSSWEVNVGGVAGAVLPVGGTAGQVLAKINSTNFNTEWKTLGTMSTEPASAYLSTASAVANYLTISSAASTYQNQSGMSAYLSTASASANFIGTSAYATTAQAQAGTSTTTVVSPSTLLDAKYFSGGKSLTLIAWSTATSGTGSVAGANSMNARIVTAPTSATGYGETYGAIVNTSRGGAYNSGIDWSKRVVFGGRFSRNVTSPDTNSVFRYTLGRFASPIPSDILATDKQVGIKVSGTSAMQLMCANGSALETVTSSFTPSNASAFDVVVTSDGAGNVALYVNGSSVATSTGGPTSTQGAFYNNVTFEAQNTSTISGGAMSVLGTDFFAQVNV